MAAVVSLLAGNVFAQVWFKVGGDIPAIGPGTKYPTILACNETNTPQQVEAWRFRTKDYAGYTTWQPGLTKTGTAPVEYTQGIPTTEQQIQAGTCRAVPTDYTGSPAAGQDATPFDVQALVKTGSCTEVPPYHDALPQTCGDVDAAKMDYANACVKDTIGANGGDTYGGFVSTFYKQNQIQAAIPANPFIVSGDNDYWNPYAMGPQYMMAMAMAQEILNVDMQFLIAIAGKETGAAMVNAATGKVRSELGDYVDANGSRGYWQVEDPTFATYAKAAPQFFPKYGACLSKYPDVTTALTAGHCAASFSEMSAFYMTPPGKGKMGINSPQITNGAFITSIGWYNLYDLMMNSTDLCFLDAIQNGVDKRIAFAAMIGGYNQGRNTDFAGPLKDPNLKNDPAASTKFSLGNNNYRVDVFNIMDNLVNAGKNCGASRKVYDTSITLNEVQRFLFGGDASVGTAENQADGGLMLHYDLTVPQRQDLWTDVTCAFAKLKGKAPSMAGKDAISYRYDWLTLLRVVKQHLPINIKDRKLPVENDWQTAVNRYSQSARTCSGKAKDGVYPSLTLLTPAQNSVVVPVVAPGAKFTFSATDNVSVAKAEWTFDNNWLAWNPAAKTTASNYEFYLPCEMAGYPKKGVKDSLWVRTTDDCGNSTIQQLNFTTHSTANCGDPPVPPQVATPTAAPGGKTFSPLSPALAVTLSDATPGASILYTLNGTDPDSVVGGNTRQYAGPIAIAATTTLKARGVKDAMGASAVMTETYTKVEPSKVETPKATPPGQSFSGTLTVTLATATPGAQILYTLNGTPPDTVAGGNTLRYTTAIILLGNATINARAVNPGLMYASGVMTENYTLIPPVPPVPVSKAWYLDKDGDGSIDGAVVEFKSALSVAPAKLGFKIVDEDGMETVRTPAGAEIQLAPGNALRAAVTFATPFPQFVTSITNSATSGQTFAQPAIPLIDSTFAVADSVAPVIKSAEVKEPGDGGALKRVLVTYSEPVTVAAGGQGLVFKRGNAETPASQILIAQTEGSGRNFIFHVDSTSTWFPVVGDSVAIALNGETKDAAGIAPAVKFFRVLGGTPPKPKPVALTVTFPNGSQKDPSSGSAVNNPSGTILIPVDKDGNALSKCGGCTAKDNSGFVGPVFHIVTPGPVEYDFSIFTNAGEFVASGKGKVEANDLPSLKRTNDASGIHYEAPIVWTGTTRSGGKAGTGAYILIASFLSEKDPATGAPQGAFKEKRVFGMIRN